LPPVTFHYYQDLLYHLSLIHELSRDLPFQVPQMAGGTLRYHYLSDADMASASLITGVDAATVLLRLWLGPILVATTVTVAAFARDVVRTWWAGPVAAGVALLSHPLPLGGPLVAPGSRPMSLLSPSLTYLIPLLMLTAAICVDLVRGRRIGPAWPLLALLALACAGAKASGVPVLVVGMLAAIVGILVTTRRLHRRALAGLAILVAAMLGGATLFVGGGAGTLGPQALSQLQWIPAYREAIGPSDEPVAGGLVPPGLRRAGGTGWVFALGLLGWWLLLQLPRWIGLLALGRRRTRTDPAVWLLAGAVVAGIGAMWLLFHPSDSQVYFFLPTLPFGAVLAVWVLADATPRRYVGTVLTVAVTVGFCVATLLWATAYDPSMPGHTYLGWSRALLVPVLSGALLLGAAVTAWSIARRRVYQLRGRGIAVLVAVVLGAALAANLPPTVDTLVLRAVKGRAVVGGTPGARSVRATEMRAARWLDAHAGPDDVVATNVHCQPVPTVPYCDSRAFWVTGLGGRRTVLEGWGYTDGAVGAQGRHGYGYPRQPAADTRRFALNERVFTDPTAADVRELQHRYATRWLFADRRAGPVSPR
ncbi:MAG: hypothetical protein WCA46_21810, partial [Actinocatenispora sp.]